MADGANRSGREVGDKMLDNIIGQTRAITLLQKLINEGFQGRTLIFYGERGIGKFTTALKMAETLLHKNPFISPQFQFYRNDDFALKTRFYLERLDDPYRKPVAQPYFFYLVGRISLAIALSETSSNIGMMQELRSTVEELLLNKRFQEAVRDNKKLRDDLILASDEVSKKKRVPIDFIREMIEFHSLKAIDSYRISVIGDFEQATTEAQNAALKLFEEPPNTSVIILTTSSLKSILPTILSRSIIIKFNPLNPQAIEQIFGENPHKLSNTVDFMEDLVYNYEHEKKEKVKEFLIKIVPQVQYGNQLFQFIDQLTDQSSNKLCIKFIEELIEFFRNLHLLRQQYIRRIDLTPYIASNYRDLDPNLIARSYVSEIKDFTAALNKALVGLQYGNINDKSILPSLLIDIARWYQMRTKK